MEGNGASKTGFDKIRFYGEQARCDRLRYFWVDTCCIDKSNAVELQEAINSMFRWYQNADQCYILIKRYYAASKCGAIIVAAMSQLTLARWEQEGEEGDGRTNDSGQTDLMKWLPLKTIN
ncbi:HET-domain-containing protein [Cadophora sp. DSE1049]|nr:HET-domain-containing protein [Cadophora sp. DSE1049]